MTKTEAIERIEAYIQGADGAERRHAERLLAAVKANGRVLPWMVNEIKYLKVSKISGAPVSVCGGGVAAEAQYNGGGSEEDISFGHAVAAYERD